MDDDTDIPPPPYEQHLNSPVVNPNGGGNLGPVPGSRRSVPNFPVYPNLNSSTGSVGGGGGGWGGQADSLGRRRSEAVRRGQDARNMLNEFPGVGGSSGGLPAGAYNGGDGGKTGSLKESGGKKDCVLM